jgi:Zn-dependent peptidase ImmA (M78 family)
MAGVESSAGHADMHDRLDLQCRAAGRLAIVVEDDALDTPAFAKILNRVPTIAINTNLLNAINPLVQIFIIAHGCGHLIASPDLTAAYHQSVDPDREKIADRIGIRLMRDQLHLSAQRAQVIADAFSNTKGARPEYLPGPLRQKWIVACYQTKDDQCGK